MRSLAFWLVGAALCLSLAPARATIQSDYLDVYMRMNNSAQLETNGDLRGALAGFEDCYTRLNKIHVTYPDWEDALVRTRMEDCKARILEVNAKVTAMEKKPSDTTPAPASTGKAVTGMAAAQARLAELQAQVKTSPKDAAAWMDLGVVYYQLNQSEPAIDALQKGLALQPNNVYGHNFLGCALSRKGRVELAVKEFHAAIDLDEGFTEAHYNLAILYATEDPPALSAARTQYKRALELGLVSDPHLAHVLHLSED